MVDRRREVRICLAPSLRYLSPSDSSRAWREWKIYSHSTRLFWL